MKRHVLLRIYPRAWRERYGEELSAQLEAQRPLRIGVVADLVRGALDAHLHPLRRDTSTMSGLNISDRRMTAARVMVMWGPVAAVAVAAVMLLIDFWYGHVILFWLVDTLGIGWPVTFWYFRADGSSTAWMRFFPFAELYDLVLHLAIAAVALACALILAAVARKARRESKPSLS